VIHLALPASGIAVPIQHRTNRYRLKTLKQLRTKADYFLDENLVTDEAAQSVVDAEAILAIA
jgi:hypothetical protein